MWRSSLLQAILLFFLLLIFSLFPQAGYAQGGDAPVSQGIEPAIHFAHLTADDGLVQNSVQVIRQDSRGFIWIGTQDGLSRFDGYTFTTYKHDPADPHSLSANHIWDIFEDRDGMLWIATDWGGVNRFDPQTETFTRYRHDPQNTNSLGGDIIFSIFQDSAGYLWFGGPPFSGLNKFDPATETFTRYFPEPDNPTGFRAAGVWKMLEDEAGNLWLAADSALVRLDPQTEQFTHYPAAPHERRLAALQRDSAGNLWAGGFAGLYRFNPQTQALDIYPPGPLNINTMQVDDQGMLWISTNGDGLYQFDPQTGQVTQHYRHDSTDVDSLSGDRITALYQDQAGVLWVGTNNEGLNLFNPQQRHFAHYHHQPNYPDSLAEDTVEGIVGDGSGLMWVGTEYVLNQIDLNSGQITHHTPELSTDGTRTVHSLYRDKAGQVWVGLSNQIIYRFDPATGKFTQYQLPGEALGPPGAPPGFIGPPMEVIGIYEDDSGALWIASIRDALYRFDPQDGTFQVYRQIGFAQGDDPDNIASNEVSALASDRAGNLWLGYIHGVLSRLDPRTQTFSHYFPELDIGWIESIYEDQTGLIWLASRQGLARFDPATETFKQYTEQDGLPTSFVVGILEDRAGNLWLSTKKGLSKFDPRQETFRNYDAADGLQGNEFIPRAAWQAADGQMFFGGVNGLTAFYPDRISDNTYQPPVVLTEFRLFNEPVALAEDSLLAQPIWTTDELTLAYDQNIISFEFAALSYAVPSKNRYRYKLEGFENDWNEVDSRRRSATYTNLPAGNYFFRVQGTNNDGLWSEHEVNLALTILPPWWETTWFRGLALALVVGLVYGGFRWRVHAIQSQNRLLEAQVALRTQELTERTKDLAQSYALLEQEIVERKQAEAQLQQAKEAAEAANRAKSIFLANMNHELRSPLNAILGFAQVMRRSQTLPPEHQENISIISRSGEHLLTLINQVLDLSKIEAERVSLNEKSFDLYRLLEDLEDMFRLKADSQGLQLLIEAAPAVPQFIRTDEMKLRQILINLLNNSLKFTEEGGVILRVKSKESGGVGQEKDDSLFLYFEIEDTGPGISLDEMDILFEAFTQTETGRQAQEGTGLGLPISRKFVQLMGGDITVKSQVGVGTIFHFYIRVQPVNESQIQNLPHKIQNRVIALEPGQPGYRLLIVDDNLTNRQLLVKLLKPLGFELREAENGQQAIKIWAEWEPHLIWMDMRMPVMDGYEATQRIKATTKGQATAIIALTASSFEEERVMVLSMGCDDFLRKPFREADLFEMMTKHIGVRYVYEADDSKLEAQSLMKKIDLVKLQSALSALPTELMTQFSEATELCDMKLVDAIITEIHSHNSELAEGLAQLARNFDYDTMLSLTQGVVE